MAEGNVHIDRGNGVAYCGAPVRKSHHVRRQECPQCKRVRKREGK